MIPGRRSSQAPLARARRSLPALGAVLLGLLATLRDATVARASELEELRRREAELTSVLARTSSAFVFLEGGSGFLISREGLILTNAHVVNDRIKGGRSDFPVHLAGGKPAVADVLGYDVEGDIALLKLRPQAGASSVELEIAPLELGDSDALQVGDRVIALGDPFLLGSQGAFFGRPPPHYEPSASAGIVSALHRYSDLYNDAIQVDVAVNRGNSGGPLLSMDGRVVGINGKIETRFENAINSGVGYAIPSNQIRRFLDLLARAEGDQVRHGAIIGLSVSERASGSRGLRVSQVRGGSYAEAAGFRRDDRILSVNGRPVPSRTRLLGITGTHPAGTLLRFEILRGEERLEIEAELIEDGPRVFLGIRTEPDPAGVRVARVRAGSPAERGGLRAGDVIAAINDKPTPAKPELDEALRALSAGDEAALEVRRGEETTAIRLRVGGAPRT